MPQIGFASLLGLSYRVYVPVFNLPQSVIKLIYLIPGKTINDNQLIAAGIVSFDLHPVEFPGTLFISAFQNLMFCPITIDGAI